MNKPIIRNISDFINTEYKEYVFYVLKNRALPSLVDGFKTGARKIMHSAFTGSLKKGALCKMPVLTGDTMRLSLYPHGDASINGTEVTLSQDFTYNLNPLEIVGQNGSLRDPKAISAPRYLSIKLSKYANLWKEDYDMLDYIFDEGEYLEPKYYLPIIPVVLCNRAEGMAPGYKFSTLSYNPIDIIDSCSTVLNSRKKKGKLEGVVIRPYVRGYDNNKLFKQEDGKWVSYGKYTCNEKKDIIDVTELPFSVSYENFESILNNLIDKEEIKDWRDFSEDGNVHYEIILNKGQLKKEYLGKKQVNKVYNKFKLKQVVPDDLLWVIDENEKIRHFETPHELVEYFVNFRLTKYEERKKRLVKCLEEKYSNNCDLIRFIELVCKGKLKIRNRSKKDVEKDMKGFKLPFGLISTPMSKCTIEERDELLKENEEIRKRLEYIKATPPKKMYLDDLSNLRKELIKDFK